MSVIIYLNTLRNGGEKMAIGGDILRGHTELIILRQLINGDSYGYEISKSIIEIGEGLLDVKDATIYTAFRRMESDNLITSYWGEGVEGARRRYYSVTELGKSTYKQKKQEWIQINRILNKLIIGG